MKLTLDYPGFIDVHVHFRDPGMTEAETRYSGGAAARAGGFAAVVTMPNTSPAGDSVEWVRSQIEDPAIPVAVFPSACITRGRLGRQVSQMEALAQAGAAFFTDDGAYVQDAKVMEEAMMRAHKLGLAICEHAMDARIQAGGVIRDSPIARKLGLPIISPDTEIAAIERDLSICRVTGCKLHIQHISTAQGVDLVRSAQKEGLPVTAEATPHHLLFCAEELTFDDANWKMAPPIGNREDRAELRKAVKDGVLMFATDHAPHPERTKSLGFAKSANGIIGLETAIAITYHVMVELEDMGTDAWARAWWQKPRELISDPFGRLECLGRTVVEIGKMREVRIKKFKSLSRNCPYDGMKFDCWPKEVTNG